MKRKDIYSYIFLLILLIGFRFSTNIENIVTIGGSSIKTIPWSDAAGWVEGSEYIQRGEVMPEFPSRRPLYPAFLSILLSLTGGTYLAAIICQIVLFSFALMICFHLLRNFDEKYAVAFFMSCIALWLPSTQSLFLTENLGAIFLVISFGLLWRGAYSNNKEFYGVGLFLLSLSFSVRPWAAGCLFTLPLLAFANKNNYKDKSKHFIFFLIMIISGFVMNMIASALFATPATASNYPQTLYGLVSNTLSWRAASLDPVISRHMQIGTAPALLNKIIYQRCLDIFIADPLLFFFSLRESVFIYFREITTAFYTEKKYLYPVFMALFAIFMSGRFRKPRNYELAAFFCFILISFLNFDNYIFLFLLGYGLVLFIIKRDSNIGMFGLLYITGIIISLPIVGIDGGYRVKISSDIFLFFVCAIAVQQFFCPTQEVRTSGFLSKKNNIFIPLRVIIICFVFFIVMPWLIYMHGNNDKEKILYTHLLLPEEVASQLNLQSNPLSISELDAIREKWPAPSYETVDGKATYRLIRYTDRDAIFLKADQWVSSQLSEFWPMGKFNLPISRTIHIRSWCIFPNIRKEFLKEHDNVYIYVAGNIIGRPRQWKHDTGYALLVEYIGVPNNDGTVTWQQISSVAH